MAWCLLPRFKNEFLQKLKSGEIDPDALASMNSRERLGFFEDFLPSDDALEVNALFESKLLLKNQKVGMITWAKKIGGITEPARRDLISKINRLENVLQPVEESKFLESLATKKLGVEVTQTEASKILKLSQNAESLRLRVVDNNFKDFDMRVEYGDAVLDFHEYMDEIAPKDSNIIANILNVPRTLKATLDLSAPLRQGWGMLSRPVHWTRAFSKMFKYAVSKKAFRELQADIISRPTYEHMKRGKLRISALSDKLSGREEAYMTTLLGRAPGVAASERAYVGFLNKLRADVFDDLLSRAEMAGERITPDSDAVRDIAKVVNDFTGSGNIGKNDRYAGTVPWINSVFFSLRKQSATVNMLNPKRYLDPKVSKTARKAAIRQLAGSLGFTATFLGLASAAGWGVETDPTSSDFGKVKVGNSRFDVTGGSATYAHLLARMITGRTKSSTTGKVRGLGEGYKPETRRSLLERFVRNKFSPGAAYLSNALGAEEDGFNAFDTKAETASLFIPIIIESIADLYEMDREILVPAVIAELFGVGVQTY